MRTGVTDKRNPLKKKKSSCFGVNLRIENINKGRLILHYRGKDEQPIRIIQRCSYQFSYRLQKWIKKIDFLFLIDTNTFFKHKHIFLRQTHFFLIDTNTFLIDTNPFF